MASVGQGGRIASGNDQTSPEIIRLTVMLYIRFPLSLQNVEDLLHERGIDVSHETVRCCWNRFGPVFAAKKESGCSGFAHSRNGRGMWMRFS